MHHDEKYFVHWEHGLSHWFGHWGIELLFWVVILCVIIIGINLVLKTSN